MPNLTEQLKELKHVKPRKDWVDAQRELLLSQISKQSSAKPQSFVLNSWFMAKSLMPGTFLRFVARPVGVLTVIVLFVLTTGMLGVNASRGSLPGELLYSVKITSEKMKVSLTVAEEKKAELHVDFAENRITEIEEINVGEVEVVKKQKKIKIAADGLKDEMQKAKNSLDKIKEEPKFKTTKAIEAAKSMDVKTEDITARLETTQKELKDDKELSKTLQEAEDAVVETSVTAVEVIVDQQEKGEIEATDAELNELREVIEKKINQIEDIVKTATEQVEGAEVIADAVIEAAAELEVGSVGGESEEVEIIEEESSEDIETTESSEVNNEKVDEVHVSVTNEDGTLNVVQAVKGVKEKPQEAEDTLAEAKDFLNQGDLTSALEKLKETTVITREVGVVVGQVEDTVVEVVEEVESSEEVTVEEEEFIEDLEESTEEEVE